MVARERGRGIVLLTMIPLLVACSGGPAATAALPTLRPLQSQPPVVVSVQPSGAEPTATTGLPSSTAATTEPNLADLLTTALPPEPAGTTWLRIAEANGRFSFEVPSTWSQNRTVPWEENNVVVGSVVVAGPAIEAFATDFGTPGVAVGVSGNPSGQSPKAAVESDDYSGSCTSAETTIPSDPAYLAAVRTWSGCGNRPGAFLIEVGVAQATSSGLVVVAFKGASQADLGYMQHVFGSLRAEGGSATPTSAPSAVGPATAPPAAQGYSVNVEECLLQGGDAIAIGTIRNDTTVSHSYRVVVRFLAKDGLLIGEYHRDTPALDPGQAYRWEVRWLAQGYTQVTCTVSEVLIHG